MNFIEPIVTREEFDAAPGPTPTYAVLNEFEAYLSSANLRDSVSITVSRAFIEGVEVTNYTALVVARFYINGDMHLQTATGHVLNASEMISDIRGLI